MAERLKIGVMGIVRGEFVLRCAPLLEEQMVVTAVCEKNDSQIEKMRPLFGTETKVYKDFDEFINSGIDAVVLCNYFHEHAAYAIKALNSGVAVLSETTAAPSLGECVDLVEAVERNNGKYMLAANCPYFKAVHGMIDIIESGKYGKVVYADAEYIHASTLDPNKKTTLDLENLHWRKTMPSCYYNMHTLGPLMYITKTMPKKVIGKGVCMPSPERVTDVSKTFALTEMDDGTVFNTTGCVGRGTTSKWFRVACENGTLETIRYDWREESLLESGCKENEFKKTLPEWSGLTPEELERYRGSFEGVGHCGIDFIMMIHFLKYLRGEEKPFFDVYRSVALSAAGILTWYSILENSKQFDIPDFKDKESREAIRGDYRIPIAKSYKDLTLPCRLSDLKKEG